MGGGGGMGGQNPYGIPPHYQQHPAPRQRTAIACRYCRRRKIRCSGFETSHDGRCANCLRFNQECIFTPVTSGTQAFVPAHAAMRGGGPLYGPHGQPLPAGYGDYHHQQPQQQPPPPPPPPQHQHHPGHSPHPSHPPPGLHPPYRLPSPVSQEPGALPPQLPAIGQNGPSSLPYARRISDEYSRHYGNEPASPSSHLPPSHQPFSPPPPTNGPSYPAASYGQGPPPPPLAPAATVPGGYYPSASTGVPPAPSSQRPDSPGSHHSTNDHHSVSPQPFIHPPMVYPPRPTSTGPSNGHSIPSMQIAGLIDHSPTTQHLNANLNQNQRTNTDDDMLNRLMPRGGL